MCTLCNSGSCRRTSSIQRLLPVSAQRTALVSSQLVMVCDRLDVFSLSLSLMQDFSRLYQKYLYSLNETKVHGEKMKVFNVQVAGDML